MKNPLASVQTRQGKKKAAANDFSILLYTN